ncbi:hypothetical protein [Achromobacter mucicolens]|uniref:hypothetical protein n=1 Tax=Achromobacter mucicolens TaxID=1389922 RepID=UPI001CBF215C|nr:hypothetical protein [Achromobacter mucicolens]UAN04813.1 hypothetical protein K9D24_12045 [Achromobacter mucicolens]
MHKPHGPNSNVHILNQPQQVQPGDDVLSTLYEALKHSKSASNAHASSDQLPNEQHIDGDGNLQLAGETAPRQTISGNNNVQIGAMQLVVNVMVNVQR